ncbi:MAG: SRPBCC family protein [Ktedonobacteraceae bacterium]
MGKVDVRESLLVGAPPEKVYKVLVDPAHHIHILPDAFSNYHGEADSTVAFSVTAFGITRNVKVRVEQTEPDKVLREIDIEQGACVEFHLQPHADGTIVTISTRYKTALTPGGLLEALCAPKFLQRVYKEELVLLERYVLVAEI